MRTEDDKSTSSPPLHSHSKGVASSDPILRNAIVEQQLTDMDLTDHADKRAENLSGGNKRKLVVALSLIGAPEVIFLDEPSAGMDPQARRKMWNIIQRIARKSKRSTVILTTHSMDECQALCSRVGIMTTGVFRCFGTISRIKELYGRGFDLFVRFEEVKPEEMLDFIRAEFGELFEASFGLEACPVNGLGETSGGLGETDARRTVDHRTTDRRSLGGIISGGPASGSSGGPAAAESSMLLDSRLRGTYLSFSEAVTALSGRESVKVLQRLLFFRPSPFPLAEKLGGRLLMAMEGVNQDVVASSSTAQELPTDLEGLLARIGEVATGEEELASMRSERTNMLGFVEWCIVSLRREALSAWVVETFDRVSVPCAEADGRISVTDAKTLSGENSARKEDESESVSTTDAAASGAETTSSSSSSNSSSNCSSDARRLSHPSSSPLDALPPGPPAPPPRRRSSSRRSAKFVLPFLPTNIRTEQQGPTVTYRVPELDRTVLERLGLGTSHVQKNTGGGENGGGGSATSRGMEGDHASFSLGRLFGLIERVKADFHIDQYAVTPTTLEEVFNGFAREEM